MFDLFRSRDKAVRILLSVILGVVALSMVTYLIPGGWLAGGGDSPDSNIIAKVGDSSITTQQAQRVLGNMTRGRNLPPEILSMYAPQMVDSLIGERAMVYEAKRLGFEASDADTAAAIRQALPQQLFKDGKLISKDLYAQVLGEQGLTIEEFESEESQQVLINRLRDFIAAGVVVSPLEVEQEYRKRNEKTKLDYVLIPTAKYSAEAQASDAELKAYFDKHKADYQVPEKKSLAVVVIDPAAMHTDHPPTDDELKAIYRSAPDKFNMPERVEVRHILIKTDGTNDKEAKAKIDDIEKQLKNGGDFAELAKKYSQDNAAGGGSAAKGGDLGFIVRGQTVKEFEDAAFSLPVHQISQPIKTTYGYHILEVMAKEPARTISFDEAKPQLLGMYMQRNMNELLEKAEDKAVADLRKEPGNPDKAAADSHADLYKVPAYAPGDPIPGVGVEKDVTTAIGSLQKGQVSPPVVLKGNKIVIVDVMDVIPSRPAAFEDVVAQIRTKVNDDKLHQVVTDKANELLAKAKSLGDLKKAAKEMGLEVKSPDAFTRSGAVEGAGSASIFTDAFTKPVGTMIGPYAAQGSVVVAQIVDRQGANMADFAVQRDGIREEITNMKAHDREGIFVDGLRKRLEQEKKIRVYNDVIKRLVDSYTARS